MSSINTLFASFKAQNPKDWWTKENQDVFWKIAKFQNNFPHEKCIEIWEYTLEIEKGLTNPSSIKEYFSICQNAKIDPRFIKSKSEVSEMIKMNKIQRQKEIQEKAQKEKEEKKLRLQRRELQIRRNKLDASIFLALRGLDTMFGNPNDEDLNDGDDDDIIQRGGWVSIALYEECQAEINPTLIQRNGFVWIPENNAIAEGVGNMSGDSSWQYTASNRELFHIAQHGTYRSGYLPM